MRLRGLKDNGEGQIAVFLVPLEPRAQFVRAGKDQRALPPAADGNDLRVLARADDDRDAALGGGFFYELVDVGDLGTGGVCDVRCALRENVIFAFRDAVGADDDLRALRHILGPLSDRQAAAAQL